MKVYDDRLVENFQIEHVSQSLDMGDQRRDITIIKWYLYVAHILKQSKIRWNSMTLVLKRRVLWNV